MKEPKASRPKFPEGYVAAPKGFVPWSWVESRLAETKNYWLITVRPDGRPHAVPKWGVWVEGKVYFDGSPETRHSRNIARNPQVTVHLESGDEVVIVEGEARALDKPAPDLAKRGAAAYAKKYAEQGYAPKADQWDHGGLSEVTPRSILAWRKFTDDPTKFAF